MELIKREQARRHLMPFMQYVSPWYRAAAHHQLIAEVLEQVELFIRTRGAQGIGRALFLLPPRHGKTELVSKGFPAWLLGRQPDVNVILTSYGADLATANSRKAREHVTGEAYESLFGARSSVDVAAPVEIAEDSRSASVWELASPHRGGVVAAGVGGAITGRGAHLLVVDDPFKNREEAENENRRAAVWQWWTSTAYTRLEQGGAVVGMLTRWHPEDWAGRLMMAMVNEALADQYHVICLPALAEPPPAPPNAPSANLGGSVGEQAAFKTRQDWMREGVWVNDEDPLGREAGAALWPEKYAVDDLRRIEANIGGYDFEALYQQRPYRRTGSLFQRDWFSIVDAIPDGVRIVKRVRYWDKAATEGAGARTAGVLLAYASNKHIYVEHVHKGQWSAYNRDIEMMKMAALDGKGTAIWHEQEPGSSGKDSAQATNRMFAEAGYTAHFETATGDKVTRAGPWSSALEGGLVHLVRGGWNAAYIDEHVAFPKGTFKDQVDGSTGAYGKVKTGVVDGSLMA